MAFPPECGTVYENTTINLTLKCAKTKGHKLAHMTRGGTTWIEPAPPAPKTAPGYCNTLFDWIDTNGYKTEDSCRRLLGHRGNHNPYPD